MARVRRPPAVARVLERVAVTAHEYQMFRAGDLVLVSVSGGPDSVCLLYALWYLRRQLRIRLAVFHFDHGLRPNSGEDAEYVRRLCVRLRTPFHLVRAASHPGRGQSVEAWGHRERTRARLVVARDVGGARVATAHTLDDQAETVLMAVLLGGGVDRIAGIDPASGLAVRPLIGVSREEVEAFCRSLRLRPRRDPTNLELRYPRNAIRLRGLPALERALRRELRRPLARTAAVVREDARELARQAAPMIGELVTERRDGSGVMIPARRLRSLAPAMAARVAHHAITACGGHPTRDHVRAILDLAGGRPGRRVDLSEGLKARRDREYVLVSRASPTTEPTREGGER